jgi:glutamate formiminotransferase
VIAFNVDLAGDDLDAAREIARAVRERDGGFPGVRALGLRLPRAGHVQVSLNVENWRAAPLHEVVAAVELEARARGLDLKGAELVGLLPAGAAVAAAGSLLRVAGLDPSHVLELRLLDE